MERFEIDNSTGRNLREVVSGLLVKSPIDAVKELVSNSYDADAEKVRLDISDKTLEIEDDGFGMKEPDLSDFVDMGGSPKVENPITPKGRECIGQFGIATTLIQFLGESYTLDSWKGGTHVSGSESFGRRSRLEYVVFRNPGKKHGTKIIIDRLKKEIDLPKLEHALVWEMPCSEDFRVYLNGKRLDRENSKPSQVFQYQETLPVVGSVSMRADFFNQRPKVTGVHIFVNERAVGRPGDFNLYKISRIIDGRVYAEVRANGLKPYVSFDRSGLVEDPVTLEVRKWVLSNLRDVSNSVRRNQRTERQMQDSSPDFEGTLQSAGIVATPYSKRSSEQEKSRKRKRLEEIKMAIDSDPGFSKVRGVKLGKNQPQAKLDRQTRELTFNMDHPWYTSPSNISPDIFKMNILLGASFALAEARYLEHGGDFNYVGDFSNLCARLLGDEDIETAIISEEDQRFIPSRKYSINEIAESHIPLTTLRALIKSKVLTTEGEFVYGSELNRYFQISANYTPAIEIARECAESRGVTRERVRQTGDKINTTLKFFEGKIPFIFNIGNGEPFFLVESEYVPVFRGLVAQEVLSGVDYFKRHIDIFGPILDRAVGKAESDKRFARLETLCEIVRGPPKEVFSVVSFAQRRGLTLPIQTQDDFTLYSLYDFKRANESYLVGGKK